GAGAGARAGGGGGGPPPPPVDYFEVVNRARTGPRGRRSRLRLERPTGPRGGRVLVSGTVPAAAPPIAISRSVTDPTRYAGAVLRAQLEAVGVHVTGEVRVAPAPVGAVRLLEFQGPSLAEVLVPFLKWSINPIGET